MKNKLVRAATGTTGPSFTKHCIYNRRQLHKISFLEGIAAVKKNKASTVGAVTKVKYFYRATSQYKT